jgi:hypothetical protein
MESNISCSGGSSNGASGSAANSVRNLANQQEAKTERNENIEANTDIIEKKRKAVGNSTSNGGREESEDGVAVTCSSKHLFPSRVGVEDNTEYCLHCDSGVFCVAFIDRTISIFDAMFANLVWSGTLHNTEGSIVNCLLNLEKNQLFVVTDDNYFVQIDPATGAEQVVCLGDDEDFDFESLEIDASNDGTYFIVADKSADRFVLWDAVLGRKLSSVDVMYDGVPCFSFDNQSVLYSCYPEIHILDCQTGAEVKTRTVPPPSRPDPNDTRFIQLIASSRSNLILAIVYEAYRKDSQLLIWDYAMDEIIFAKEFRGRRKFLQNACFGPLDDIVIFADTQAVMVCNIATKAFLKTFSVVPGIQYVNFNHNRNTILVTVAEETLTYCVAEIDYELGNLKGAAPVASPNLVLSKPVVVLLQQLCIMA